jgi:hypothetical protein
MRRSIEVKSLVLVLSVLVTSSALAEEFASAQEENPLFGGPLLGLSSAPNGGLLVADSRLGVISLRHGEIKQTIALPGVSDASAIGHTLWAVVGGQPAGRDSGQGLYLLAPGGSTKIANLFEFETANNPDGVTTPPESNPFDVQSVGPFGALVADAAANDLLFVDRHGNVRVLAIFPTEVVSTANIKTLAGCPSASPFCGLPDTMPTQAVPTSIAIGRDGHIYVGELKGLPAPTGRSSIWRVSPFAYWAQCGSSPHCVKVFDGGFTSIIDLAVGRDGNLYVTEMDEKSWAAVQIFRAPAGGTVNSCNLKTLTCHEVATQIPVPTAIAFDKRGTLWATRNALTLGSAEVVAIDPAGAHP